MFDEPLKSCPKCNSVVRRVISGGSGLIFKGSGFYITDYKAKNSQSGPPARKAGSGGKTESENKTVSKPAAKEKTD